MTVRRTILVVDDERAIADLLAELLEDEGYAVYTAHSGEEALVQLKTLRPDAIMIDLYMPVISGASLLTQLRGMAEFERTPVIVMSASAPAANALQDEGADAILLKPFSLETALACVAQVL